MRYSLYRFHLQHKQAAFGLVLLLTTGFAFQKPKELPEGGLSKAQLEADLRFLASDELAGRMVGSAEANVAARYIAEQFRAAGVTPAPGLKGYLQDVPLARRRLPTARTFLISGKTAQKQDVLILEGSSLELDEQAVFAGFGMTEAGDQNGDYKGLDVKGKIAVVRYGSKREGVSDATLFRRKVRTAAAQGALALVELYSGSNWEALAAYMNRPQIDLRDEEGSASLPHLILHDPEDAFLSALRSDPTARVQLRSDPHQEESVQSSNVAGVIAGSDPLLRDEYIVLMAHYDHVGSGLDLPGSTPEDSIFNGARDNAMGVVALLAAARTLADHPPARSVLLLAVTGEEEGLLGSRYYTEHPAVPLTQTVFVLNVDGAGFTDTGIVTVIGLERTTARKQIEEGSKAFGLEAIPAPRGSEGLFDRSDNVSFARKGVPAPTFSPGFRAFDEELARLYHRPGDEAGDDFDYEYLKRFSQAYTRVAREIADQRERPRWKAGDPYESTAKTLYGGR